MHLILRQLRNLIGYGETNGYFGGRHEATTFGKYKSQLANFGKKLFRFLQVLFPASEGLECTGRYGVRSQFSYRREQRGTGLAEGTAISE